MGGTPNQRSDSNGACCRATTTTANTVAWQSHLGIDMATSSVRNQRILRYLLVVTDPDHGQSFHRLWKMIRSCQKNRLKPELMRAYERTFRGPSSGPSVAIPANKNPRPKPSAGTSKIRTASTTDRVTHVTSLRPCC